MLEDIAYDALRRRELVFDEENLGHLAEVFEYRIPGLAREFGTSQYLRLRLAEIVGSGVTR